MTHLSKPVLRSCPFCSSVHISYKTGYKTEDGYEITIFCKDCQASGPKMYSLNQKPTSKNIDIWNKRPEIDVLSKDVICPECKAEHQGVGIIKTYDTIKERCRLQAICFNCQHSWEIHSDICE